MLESLPSFSPLIFFLFLFFFFFSFFFLFFFFLFFLLPIIYPNGNIASTTHVYSVRKCNLTSNNVGSVVNSFGLPLSFFLFILFSFFYFFYFPFLFLFFRLPCICANSNKSSTTHVYSVRKCNLRFVK